MLVGIHQTAYGKYPPLLTTYEAILDHNRIPHVRLTADASSFWHTVESLSLFIFRYGHYDTDHLLAQTLLPIVERELGVSCFPNWQTCWHYDDKIRQYYLMKAHGHPMIESYTFWEKRAALEWANSSASFPVVFKLKGGAGSNNVLLVRTRKKACRLISTMFGRGVRTNHLRDPGEVRFRHFGAIREIRHIGGNLLRWLRDEDASEFWQLQKNYVLFQKYLTDNDYDTRITVIGSRAFGFRRRVRARDFRASGSGSIDYAPTGIDLRCVDIAFAVCGDLGFQSMAFDFLRGESGEPQFCEISYTYWDQAIFNCPGHWDKSLTWVEGHTWPQVCILRDLLGIPDLKQPELARGSV